MQQKNSSLSSQISQFKKKGFIVLPNILSSKTCENYKKKLNIYYKKYSSYYADANSKKNDLSDKNFEKVVYNLHNKDYSWFKLFENKNVTKVLDIILKEGSYNNSEPYYLANISARCPLKFNKGQQLHSDSNLAGVNYSLSVNVLWMLDDFNEQNGATRIVPESHLYKKYASNNIKYSKESVITAPKGSVLIFNTSLWHGSSKKLDDSSRWAVVLGYYRWFLKPSFEFQKNTPKKIFSRMTKNQKKLLGFDSIPPKDEFTRVRRRSKKFLLPFSYKLPNVI